MRPLVERAHIWSGVLLHTELTQVTSANQVVALWFDTMLTHLPEPGAVALLGDELVVAEPLFTKGHVGYKS